MEYKQISPGVNIPVLGLGTWQMGGRTEPDYSKDKEEIQAIKDALSMGYTLIDTAEYYGAGHAEELIGKAIKNVDRKKLFIVSKVMASNLAYDNVIKSAKRSLKSLGIDYFDLYLIHAPNKDIPIKETMRAMDYLVEKKLTKLIGVSNFSVKEMKEAQKYSKNKIVANQVQYSLMTREESTYCNCTNIESEIIPYCQKNNILIMADRPLDKGLLMHEENELLNKLCKKYNKTKAQIAMNWLISKKGIITIPKSTNKEHLKENIGAVGWKLDEKDVKLLDKIKF